MTAPRGRTYRVPIDVFVDEFVTVLESGDLVLEGAISGVFMIVEQHRLDEFGDQNPPHGAHIVHCIRRALLSTTRCVRLAMDPATVGWLVVPERTMSNMRPVVSADSDRIGGMPRLSSKERDVHPL